MNDVMVNGIAATYGGIEEIEVTRDDIITARLVRSLKDGLRAVNKMASIDRICRIARKYDVMQIIADDVREANARIRKIEKRYNAGVILRYGSVKKLVNKHTHKNPRMTASGMVLNHGWEIVSWLQ